MRTYIKPVMESEAFVANEFVAACWTVTCGTCGAWEEGYDNLASQVVDSSVGSFSGAAFPGSLENKGPGRVDGSPCTTYDTSKRIWIWDVDSWEMFWAWLSQYIFGFDKDSLSLHPGATKVEGWTHTKHPNASV